MAAYLPGFAVVSHVGRTSGRLYRTPVNAFRGNGGYTIALTYGSASDWVRNVLAAGGCEIETRGRRMRLTAPRLGSDRDAAWAPPPVRLGLTLVRAPEYLRLSLAEPA